MLVYQGHYVPDRLVPLRVGFANRTDAPITGSVGLGDDATPILGATGAAATFHQNVDVPPRSRVQFVGHAYFPASAAPGPARSTMLGGVAWRGQGGAEVDFTRLSGIPASFILLTIGDRTGINADSPFSTFNFAPVAQAILGAKPSTIGLAVGDLPRHGAALDTVRALILDGVDPQQLDMAQRQAVVDYLFRGGTLVIHCPDQSMQLSTSWLADHLPVRIVGYRQAAGLSVTSPRIPFDGRIDFVRHSGALSTLLPLCEATEGDGSAHVVLRDEHYVHAAWRPVGLGRIVFTSFPLSALPADQERTAALWRELLGPGDDALDWRTNGMLHAPAPTAPQAQAVLMQSLVGLSVPGWGLAGGMAAAYVLIIIFIQLFVRGARRPLAYVLTTLLAIGLAVAILLLQRGSRGQPQLTGGRLAAIDLGPEGGGRLQEVVCYYGRREPDLTVEANNPSLSLRPVIAPPSDPAHLRMLPAAAIRAAAPEALPRQFWLADVPVPSSCRIDAALRFGAAGATLTIDNQSGGDLDSPLLVYGLRGFRLGAIPQGPSQRPLADRAELAQFNAPDDREPRWRFAMASVLTERAKLREEFFAELHREPQSAIRADRPAQPQLQLAGWADQEDPSLRTRPSLDRPLRQAVLVRAPVRFEGPPLGQEVLIDGAFTQMVFTALAGLPYDITRQKWNPSHQGGRWVVGFATPPEIGRLKLTEATIALDIQAPSYNVSVGGRTGTGRTTFNGPLGRHTARIAPAPGDVDENGWVWIELVVTGGAAPGGVPPRWELTQILLSCRGQVVGPPSAPVLRRGDPPTRPVRPPLPKRPR